MSPRLPPPVRPGSEQTSKPERPRRAKEFVYLVLDAARSPKIPEYVLALPSDFMCLYSGQSRDSLADVAPYLVRVDPTGEVFKWFLSEGWADSWGIIVTSPAPMEDVHKHFRKFLLVQDEDGKTLYFRFYDPRVIGVFLKSCTPEETAEFFGPLSRFLFERSNGQGQSICNGPTGAYAEKTDLVKGDIAPYLLVVTTN